MSLHDARRFVDDFKSRAQSLVPRLISLKWSMLEKNLTTEIRNEIVRIIECFDFLLNLLIFVVEFVHEF